MQDSITERIKILVEARAEKPADFAKATGLTSQNVYDLTSGRKGAPGFASIKKILIAFPDVDERWLLLGEGEMLKKPLSSTNSEEPQNISSYKGPVPATDYHGGNIHTGIRAGEPASFGGMVVPTYSTPGPKRTKSAPTEAPAAELPGLDLLRLVATHGTAIEALTRAVQALQQQANQPAEQ